MSFIGRIIGIMFFNRKQTKNIAEKDDATGQAWFIIFVGSIIGGILSALAYQATNDPQYLGFMGSVIIDSLNTGSSTSLIALTVINFLYQALFILFLAFVLSFVGKIFGGKYSTMEVVRIIGFASIIGVLSTVVSYAAAINNTSTLLIIGTVLTIWQFCVFIYAYSVGGDIGIIRSLIAFIVALIVAVLLLVLIVIFVFVAIYAALSTI